MKSDALARRYARALFRLAEEQDVVDAIANGLTVAAQIVGHPDVAGVTRRPLARSQKRAMVEAIADQIAAPTTLRSFLLLLDEHGRLANLAAIQAVFGTLVDERRGITRAIVRSATQLPDDVLAELTRVFGSMTGKQVVADVRVDPTLIAGVVVEIDGRVYDGSLETQLRKLQQQMASGG